MNSSVNEAEQKLREALKGLSAKVGQWKGKGLSEADTKRTLIEPLLAALGWDIHDPGEVRSEWHTAGGRADYALLADGAPQAFVEAKALDIPLTDADAAQLIKYAATEGVRWGLLTNGATFRLYDSFNTGPLPEKVAFQVLIEQLPGENDEAEWTGLVGGFSPMSEHDAPGEGVEAERKADITQISQFVSGEAHRLYVALMDRIGARLPFVVPRQAADNVQWGVRMDFWNRRGVRLCRFHVDVQDLPTQRHGTLPSVLVWFDAGCGPSPSADEGGLPLERLQWHEAHVDYRITDETQISSALLDWLDAAQ